MPRWLPLAGWFTPMPARRPVAAERAGCRLTPVDDLPGHRPAADRPAESVRTAEAPAPVTHDGGRDDRLHPPCPALHRHVERDRRGGVARAGPRPVGRG